MRTACGLCLGKSSISGLDKTMLTEFLAIIISQISTTKNKAHKIYPMLRCKLPKRLEKLEILMLMFVFMLLFVNVKSGGQGGADITIGAGTYSNSVQSRNKA